MSLLPNTDSFIEILSCFSCGAQNTKKKQHILVTNFMNFFLSAPLEQLISHSGQLHMFLRLNGHGPHC